MSRKNALLSVHSHSGWVDLAKPDTDGCFAEFVGEVVRKTFIIQVYVVEGCKEDNCSSSRE